MARAWPRSFTRLRAVNPGRWSPASTRVKRCSSCHEAPVAPSTTRRSSTGSTPARWPRPSASAVPAAIVATMRLLTSLATSPAPTGPQWARRDGSPIASRAGSARRRASASPPHMMARVPASAPGGPPLTGQSRYATPRAAHSPASSRATAGRDRAELDQDGRRRGRGEEPGHHLAHVARVGDARAGQVGAVHGLGHARGEDGGQPGGSRRRAGVQAHLVAGRGQVAHHPRAHQPRPHESDPQEGSSHGQAKGRPAAPPPGRGSEAPGIGVRCARARPVSGPVR